MPRIALGLAYEGAAWQGWQTQPHGQTVQDAVELALARFSGKDQGVPTVCAGRTDTGVHAAMQVIHVDTLLDRRMESWVRGVNAFLPSSISVQWAQQVSEDFHARFCARSRTYMYLLYCGRVRPALWAGRAGWCFHALDVAQMRQATEVLLGEHDFSSFRSSQCQAKHPVRTLYCLDIEERGPFLVFTLRANAFLHHMVRNLMGALLQVGQGRETPAWMAWLLNAKDRRQGAPTFAPDGLYLSGIDYPEEFGLTELDSGAALMSPFTFSTR